MSRKKKAIKKSSSYVQESRLENLTDEQRKAYETLKKVNEKEADVYLKAVSNPWPQTKNYTREDLREYLQIIANNTIEKMDLLMKLTKLSMELNPTGKKEDQIKYKAKLAFKYIMKTESDKKMKEYFDDKLRGFRGYNIVQYAVENANKLGIELPEVQPYAAEELEEAYRTLIVPPTRITEEVFEKMKQKKASNKKVKGSSEEPSPPVSQ